MKGISAFLVPRDTEGVEFGQKENKLGIKKKHKAINKKKRFCKIIFYSLHYL